MNDELANRWRLVLGRYADDGLGLDGGDFRHAEMDGLLDYLYRREYQDRDIADPTDGGDGRDKDDDGDPSDAGGHGRHGSLDPSQPTPIDWINHVHRLFPKEVAEKIQHHALDRYGLSELLTDERVLSRLEPNMDLLRHILAFKNLMNEKVLDTARHIVRRVVEDLKRRMAARLEQSIMGRRDRNRSSPVRRARNFDFRKTVARNLRHYDVENERLTLRTVYFNHNVQRHLPWEVVLLVDESGSMVDNVIHAAVMAGIFAGLPALTVKLVIFDTNVVDLTGHASDPVETLMRVQLGGGTDIGKALAYGAKLVGTPHRCLVVLVSDLYDGAGYRPMYRAARDIVEAGAKLFCLTALDADCQNAHDRTAAKRLAALGARVAAVTPYQLADWIGDAIRQ